MTIINPNERRFSEQGVVAKPTDQMGWGLFAEVDFAPGACIFYLKLGEDPRKYLCTWEESFGECIDRGFTIFPGFSYCSTADHPFWYLNHSCNPNSGLTNWGYADEIGIPIVTHRHIGAGQQITTDYSAITTSYDGTLTGEPWTMSPCMCGEPSCRHIITGFEALPMDLQQKTILPDSNPQGRVMAHIVHDIPGLADILQQSPLLYARYSAALQQQIAFSAQLGKAILAQKGA